MAPSSPSATTPAASAQNERLEVPTLPPPSSRFVLPPPPSELLSRLQAFLPQIAQANALLERQQPAEGEEREEAVVMEELSDSSDDDSDSSDDSSDSDSNSDDEASEAEAADGEQQEEGDSVEEARGLAGLLDIAARPKAGQPKQKVLVQEEGAAKKDDGEVKMEAD
ncbi:hypothetical protein JCM10213_008702 [Rhodosporidiobolus nylandii]